jgi:integrase
MALEKLTLAGIKATKPKDKPYTLPDGGGLVLLVNPNGSKWWRYRYRFNGIPKMLSLGTFPDTSLTTARQKHRTARTQLADGIDPSAKRQAEKDARADTFKALAEEYLDQAAVNDSTKQAMRRRFELYIYPRIGKRPVGEIDAQELLQALRKVEARGTYDTTRRIRSACSRVFRYAVSTGRASGDPAEVLKGALKTRKAKHRAAITDIKKIGPLMRAIDTYFGHPITVAALKLLPHVFVRPGELRHMEWSEIDWSDALWEIPGEKMKMGEAHIVPLSKQSIEILRELYPLTGPGGYVFPGMRSAERPMSDNTLNAAIRGAGYSNDQMVAHGFRAMARTVLDEELKFRPDFIEHQLAHVVKDSLGRAYNRTTHLKERAGMMQAWSDYLDSLKGGADVVQFSGEVVA